MLCKYLQMIYYHHCRDRRAVYRRVQNVTRPVARVASWKCSTYCFNPRLRKVNVPTPLCFHSFMFPQLYVPTTLCFHSFMFPQLYVPTTLFYHSSVFTDLCSHSSVPTALCSHSSVFTALCSYSSMFLQPYVPTTLCFYVSIFPQLCSLSSMFLYFYDPICGLKKWISLKICIVLSVS